MHSLEFTMEDITVKADPSEPSDSTKLGHQRGVWDEVRNYIHLKADPDHLPSKYESTNVITADLPSSTLTCNSADVKPTLGDESKDAPTSDNTKDVPRPKIYINHTLASLCGEFGTRSTPLLSTKSLPFRSVAKRKSHECTGLPYQVDPIVPQYEADPYGSGEDILNDPLNPDPDDTSAEYRPSLNETDPTRSNALPDYDEVKKEEFHDDPSTASMVTNDSSDLKYDEVTEYPTKILACEETLSKQPIISGIVGARTDLKMIAKNPPSTSAPRRKSFEPLTPIRGASTTSARIKKASEGKPYGCDVCDYRAARAFTLRKHMATHTGEKPFACNVCDYRAAQAPDLKRHMATHTGEKPYGCDVCDYRAARASHLKLHMTTHSDEKPYGCDVCDYRAARTSHLKRHMATHTGERPYACDLCDYRAALASHLKKHMATHSGEKPYGCDVCDYRAAQAYTLREHMATHTGERPYGCDVCDYRAARATHLKLHMATHTGERPYGCDVCDYRAARASYLKTHMATHTGMEGSAGGSSVPQCSDAGMMSSDTEGTSKAGKLMAGPSHHVDPIVAHDDEDLYQLSVNSSLNFPLKLDPDDPTADYGSSSSMTTDLHRSELLLGHDEVKTEWFLEADARQCDPLEVSAHHQTCEPPLQLQLAEPPNDGDPHQLSADVRSSDIIKMEQYD